MVRWFGSVRVGDRFRVGAVVGGDGGDRGRRRRGHGDSEPVGAGVWLFAVVLGVLVGLVVGCVGGWLLWAG